VLDSLALPCYFFTFFFTAIGYVTSSQLYRVSFILLHTWTASARSARLRPQFYNRPTRMQVHIRKFLRAIVLLLNCIRVYPETHACTKCIQWKTNMKVTLFRFVFCWIFTAFPSRLNVFLDYSITRQIVSPFFSSLRSVCSQNDFRWYRNAWRLPRPLSHDGYFALSKAMISDTRGNA